MNRVRAVLLPPGPRLHAALAAALDGSGPAICPLSPELPAAALSSLLKGLAPHEIEDSGGITPYSPPGGGRADGIPTDAAVLIATSGSTGPPKIVELGAAALESSARAALTRLEAGTEPWLCCLPTSHIAGIQVLVRALVSGTTPIILDRFDPDTVARAGPVHVSLVPTQLRRLLDTGADLSGHAAILLGGAAAAPALLAQARARGARLVTTYGMSETSGGCVYEGVPLNGVRVSIGGDGRIRIAGPTLFTGYRLRPRATAAARDGDWFITQDLGTLNDGRLVVLGRADDVINTGGEKVVAGEVQAVLAGHPAVADVVVVGRPDPEWGEAVTAIVVPAGPVTLAELRDWIRARLPAHAAPRILELCPVIPLLPSGKPDREALRLPGSGGPAAS